MTPEYNALQPAHADVEAMPGPALLDFGTNWCGHCLAAQPIVAQALESHRGVRHIKVEDGSGRTLGRAYGVTLWPTLVFLRDGKEVARLVRPRETGALERALALIDSPLP